MILFEAVKSFLFAFIVYDTVQLEKSSTKITDVSSGPLTSEWTSSSSLFDFVSDDFGIGARWALPRAHPKQLDLLVVGFFTSRFRATLASAIFMIVSGYRCARLRCHGLQSTVTKALSTFSDEVSSRYKLRFIVPEASRWEPFLI